MVSDFSREGVRSFYEYLRIKKDYKARDKELQEAISKFNKKYQNVHVRTDSTGEGFTSLNKNSFWSRLGVDGNWLPNGQERSITESVRLDEWISVDIETGSYEQFFDEVGSKIEEWDRLSDNYGNRNVMRTDEKAVRKLLRAQEAGAGSDISYVNGDDYIFHMRRLNTQMSNAWLPGFGRDWAKERTIADLTLAQKVFAYTALKDGYDASIQIAPVTVVHQS